MNDASDWPFWATVTEVLADPTFTVVGADMPSMSTGVPWLSVSSVTPEEKLWKVTDGP